MRWGMLVALLLLVAAPSAHAGTVSLKTTEKCECDSELGGVEYTTFELRWSGDPGEANTASVSWSANAFHVKDATAPLAAGDGCTTTGPGEADCFARADCQAVAAGLDCDYTFDVRLDGGDGDDVLSGGSMSAVISAAGASQQETRLVLRGGDGNDTLNGGPKNDVLLGGPGTDTLHGGNGDDLLAGDGLETADNGAMLPDAAPAADVIDGGPGADTVTYAGRGTPVAVDLAAGVGGEPGEGDKLNAVENVDGTAAGDAITGDAGRNELSGEGGDDRVDGAGGSDIVSGGAGRDDLHGGAGNDILEGDGFRDQLAPDPPPARDVLDGGPGTDAASWQGRSDRIVVDLSDPGPDGEPAAPDRLVSVENVQGGRGADVLIGDNGPNVLDGGATRGRLVGKGGDDTLVGGDTSTRVDGGAGNDLVRGGSRRTTCGRGADRISTIDRRLPRRGCEVLAAMSSGWDPIQGRAIKPLLEFRNAPSRATRRAVTLRVRCPFRDCLGTLQLNPDFYDKGSDGSARLRLTGTRWQRVTLRLTPRGSRRVARHRRLQLWLVLDDDAVAPVELRR